MATTVETFANLPSTTVSSGGTTAPVSGTQETWTVASSASFPAANSGATPPTQFHVADTATGKTSEIIAVTLVSGTTWTVTRGAESTTPVAHAAGFTVNQVVTAAGLGGMLQSASNLSDVASASTARTNLGLGSAATQNTTAFDASGAAAAAQAAAEAASIPVTAAGAASGVATLDSGSHVPVAQLPAGTTSARGALQLDGTAADIQPLGAQAAGATGKAPDAGHVHPYQPWQFYARSYGAKGDGTMLTDAAMTASSKVLTSASASFTAGDIGKHILVNNAGPAAASDTSGALFTTIASVQSATQVTLTAAASRTMSAMTAMYGTDDTAAIQAAMNALMTYPGFAGAPYYAELLFDPLVYVLASMPVPGGNLAGGLTYGNAQIPLPVVDLTGLKPKPTVVLRGLTSDNSVLDSYHQSVPQITGPCLFSMVEITNANHSDPTYGPVSVIGGPTVNAPFGGSNFFNNVLAVIDGLQVVCPPNPGQVALDFFLMAQFAIKTASLDVFASVTGTPAIQFTGAGPVNANGLGLRVPFAGLNDRCDIGSLSVEGYYTGMTADEHVAAVRVAIIYTNTGIYIPAHGGNQASHGCWFGYASVEICQYCVWAESASGSLFGLYIDVLDNEGPVTEHIHDPSGYLGGRVNILPSQSQGLPVPPVINGAANLEIITGASRSPQRGAVTAPSVPSSGVAFQNPFWRHASVVVTGGDVTGIAVDGQAAGLTAGSVLIPSGKTITLTCTSAPSWNWWLL